MVKDLSPRLLEQVAERFRVLGDSTRLLLLQTLMQAEGELNVGELVERLNMSQANISKHLRILLDSGMVARRPVGTAAYYSVTDASVVQLCDLVCDRLKTQANDEARSFAIA